MKKKLETKTIFDRFLSFHFQLIFFYFSPQCFFSFHQDALPLGHPKQSGV
jgi:hypothetical protein